MKDKNISMLNPYSFKYIWNFKEGKIYIQKILNYYLNNKEEYKLLNYFNESLNNVRSYCIFESNKNIVLLDFNLNHRKLDDDLLILHILKLTSNKKINFILFNNYKGQTTYKNNIWNIYINDSFIFAKNYQEQVQIYPKLTKYLYTMQNKTYKLYLHENYLMKLVF